MKCFFRHTCKLYGLGVRVGTLVGVSVGVRVGMGVIVGVGVMVGVGASVILADPIFQGLAISLMAGEIASLLISRMAVPVLYFMAYDRKAS